MLGSRGDVEGVTPLLLSRELQPTIDTRPDFTMDNNSLGHSVYKEAWRTAFGGQQSLSRGVSSAVAAETGHVLAFVEHKALLTFGTESSAFWIC